MRIDIPPSHAFAVRVYCNYYALVPKFRGSLRYEVRIRYCGSVQRNLVSARVQHEPNVFKRPEPSAYRKGHKAFAGGALHDVAHNRAVVARSRYIQKHQFVGALVFIRFCLLHGVSRVNKVHEVYALYDPTVAHVEARYYSYA